MLSTLPPPLSLSLSPAPLSLFLPSACSSLILRGGGAWGVIITRSLFTHQVGTKLLQLKNVDDGEGTLEFTVSGAPAQVRSERNPACKSLGTKEAGTVVRGRLSMLGQWLELVDEPGYICTSDSASVLIVGKAASPAASPRERVRIDKSAPLPERVEKPPSIQTFENEHLISNEVTQQEDELKLSDEKADRASLHLGAAMKGMDDILDDLMVKGDGDMAKLRGQQQFQDPINQLAEQVNSATEEHIATVLVHKEAKDKEKADFEEAEDEMKKAVSALKSAIDTLDKAHDAARKIDRKSVV